MNVALNDTVTGFVHSELTMEKKAELFPVELWDAYLFWCGRNMRNALPRRDFLKEMARAHLTRLRPIVDGTQKTTYFGARLKSREEKQHVDEGHD
jgi:hypothetical protein